MAEDLKGAGRVLEVAAGTGLVTVGLAKVASTVVATDRSAEMLDILRGRIGEAQLTNVEVKPADVMALPFRDGEFDAVVAANVLHLLPSPAGALAEMKRVLRSGGTLCAPTFAHGENLPAHVVSRVLGLVGFPVVTRFGKDRLSKLLEGAGFRVSREVLVPGLLPIRYITARTDGATHSASYL